MTATKNLIFDLGNVLYDIDFEKMYINSSCLEIKIWAAFAGYFYALNSKDCCV